MVSCVTAEREYDVESTEVLVILNAYHYHPPTWDKRECLCLAIFPGPTIEAKNNCSELTVESRPFF